MKLFFAALLSALLVATASPAMADRIVINDPADDHVPPGGDDFHGVGDVTKVRVDHAPKRVYVDTVFRVEPYDVLEVEIDTRKGHPGAEFLFLKTPLGLTLWRGGVGDERVKCADKRLKYLPKQRTWAGHVNRGCLRSPNGDTPRQVRVRLLSASDDYYFTRDYVPGKHRFSRWVQHN
jgi:hypothetical protein